MKLYCGTYKKYNEGSLFGKWMDLADYKDAEEFLEACYELHKDEEDPELMFQDYEADESWEGKLYSECSVPEEWWDIHDALENSYIDEDIYSAYLSCVGDSPSVESIKACEEKYCGHYDSGADYAQELAEECGDIDSKNWLMRYIDWDAVWRDMTFDSYYEEDGYIFDMNR